MYAARRNRFLKASPVVIGIAGVIGVVGAGSDQLRGEPATVGTAESVAQESISQLEQNLTDVAAQQRLERNEAAAAFSLPPGASFSAPESFEGITSQISNLETIQRNRSISTSADGEPQLYWYEDGFFTSLMALDWHCAWLSTGVAQVESGNMEGVAEAVETLHSFTSTRYISSFPDYDTFLVTQVDPLLKGNTSGAYSYLPNCSPSTLVN